MTMPWPWPCVDQVLLLHSNLLAVLPSLPPSLNMVRQGQSWWWSRWRWRKRQTNNILFQVSLANNTWGCQCSLLHELQQVASAFHQPSIIYWSLKGFRWLLSRLDDHHQADNDKDQLKMEDLNSCWLLLFLSLRIFILIMNLTFINAPFPTRCRPNSL